MYTMICQVEFKTSEGSYPPLFPPPLQYIQIIIHTTEMLATTTILPGQNKVACYYNLWNKRLWQTSFT